MYIYITWFLGDHVSLKYFTRIRNRAETRALIKGGGGRVGEYS